MMLVFDVDGNNEDGGAYSAAGGAGGGGKFSPGVVVRLLSEGDEEEDEEEQVKGTIVGQTADGFNVKTDSGEVRSVLAGQIKAVVPDKNDEVKIVSGDHKGGVGTLIGIDEGVDAEDGIVKIVAEIIIVPLSTLVKFRKED